MKDEKRKKLEKVIQGLKKKNDLSLGFGAVEKLNFIQTPFVTLNTLTGGGLPRGRFTTVGGAERTAKGTLLLQIIAYNQQLDPTFMTFWTDAENALDVDWCRVHGVDLDRVVVQKYSDDATNLERLFDDGLKIIETGAIDMWVIDSIG